jgi:hypothetical protein
MNSHIKLWPKRKRLQKTIPGVKWRAISHLQEVSTVNNVAGSLVAFSFLLLCAPAVPQVGHPPGSPSLNGSHDLILTDREIPSFPRRIDPARLEKDARALATAASSIPSDIESVRKGVLPKDVVQKLKQIEKLAKQLRNELNP